MRFAIGNTSEYFLIWHCVAPVEPARLWLFLFIPA
jgi:hypothetical protein